MDEEPETAVGTAEEDAAFGAGFGGSDDKPAAKPDKATTKPDAPDPAAAPRAEEPEPGPKYVQVTESDWAEVRAAAAKTASYDSQLAKAFGTIGNLQRLVNEQRATANPAAAAAIAKRFEVPKEAFAAMERDFPELAQQTRAALEAALSGLPVNGASDADPARLEAMLAQEIAKRELKTLEEEFPDWREKVGAAPAGEQDPEHPFRKWLATKDAAYQNRINASESAAVLSRAIRTYQRETAAKPAAPARDTARQDRIRGAIQPRGDQQGASPTNTAEDAFAAGFAR